MEVKKLRMESQKSKMNFIHFIILFKGSKEFRIRVIYKYWSLESSTSLLRQWS